MTSASTDLPPRGRFDGERHLFPVRVYYEDTDLSGVAYHANYLRWMERARTEMLRAIGIDHAASVARGEGGYAVASLAIRYHAPARLDDALLVASRLVAVGGARAELAQDVMRGDRTLSSAEVRLAFLAPDGRPRRQPPHWTQAMRSPGATLPPMDAP